MGGEFPMKCPYCKKRGAKIDHTQVEKIIGEAPIHSAVECRNPACIAYNPIVYGDHPDMNPEKRRVYKKFKRMIQNESDFDWKPPASDK